MRRLLTLSAIVVALAPAPASAWGKTGHRVIGAIAARLVGRHTRREVRRLLGPEGLAEASTAPDFERSNPDPFWQKEAGPYHYVTVPPGRTYPEVGAPAEGDAVTALARFAATVRDAHAPLADRRLALRFVVHIVGDLQQPFHAGNGSDDGANKVKVRFFGAETNLHAVWDSGLIDQEQLSYSELARWLAARITPAERRDWATTDPRVWIAESVAIRDRAYPPAGGKTDADGRPLLGFDYVYAWTATRDLRLEQGGVRLAAYLDALFAGKAL